jgi:hypothetical protein
MLHSVVRFYKKIERVVRRATSVLLRGADEQLRLAWKFRASRVRQDPTYAAVTAIVLGGLFGAVPPKEVLAAVLAGVLGLAVNSRQRPSYDTGRDVHRWNDDTDGTDLY